MLSLGNRRIYTPEKEFYTDNGKQECLFAKASRLLLVVTADELIENDDLPESENEILLFIEGEIYKYLEGNDIDLNLLSDKILKNTITNIIRRKSGNYVKASKYIKSNRDIFHMLVNPYQKLNT